jgi:hypothetical protein
MDLLCAKLKTESHKIVVKEKNGRLVVISRDELAKILQRDLRHALLVVNSAVSGTIERSGDSSARPFL